MSGVLLVSGVIRCPVSRHAETATPFAGLRRVLGYHEQSATAPGLRLIGEVDFYAAIGGFVAATGRVFATELSLNAFGADIGRLQSAND